MLLEATECLLWPNKTGSHISLEEAKSYIYFLERERERAPKQKRRQSISTKNRVKDLSKYCFFWLSLGGIHKKLSRNDLNPLIQLFEKSMEQSTNFPKCTWSYDREASGYLNATLTNHACDWLLTLMLGLTVQSNTSFYNSVVNLRLKYTCTAAFFAN